MVSFGLLLSSILLARMKFFKVSKLEFKALFEISDIYIRNKGGGSYLVLHPLGSERVSKCGLVGLVSYFIFQIYKHFSFFLLISGFFQVLTRG